MPGNSVVTIALGPYAFEPDIIQRRGLNTVVPTVRFDFIFQPDADAPQEHLFNPPGAAAAYVATWRHVSP